MAAGTGVFRLLGAMRMGEPVRGPRAVEAGSAAIPGEVVGKKRNLKHSSDTSNYWDVHVSSPQFWSYSFGAQETVIIIGVINSSCLIFFWKLDFLSGVFKENA